MYANQKDVFGISILEELSAAVRGFLLDPAEHYQRLKEIYEGNPLFFESAGRLTKKFMLTGGYPRSVLAGNVRESFLAIQEIANTYVEKDILSDLKVDKITEFEGLIEFLSISTGGILNINSISRQLGLTVVTIKKFLNILEHTFIISRLGVFSSNRIRSLRKARKAFFIDQGFRNLFSRTMDSAVADKEKGILLEGFVFSQLLKNRYYWQSTLSKIHFWRNGDKNEVDFIVSLSGKIIPIEVKSSGTIERGYRAFIEKANPEAGIMITENKLCAVPIRNNLRVFLIPASLLSGI